MLVLSRRCGESVRIDENITLKVLAIKGSQVSIGIAAPRTVVVDREEIHERKRQHRESCVGR